MDHVKIVNGEVAAYPYSAYQLRSDNPNTSFPEIIGESLFVEYGVFNVTHLDQPMYNKLTQKIVQDTTPTLINDEWCVGWTIVDLSSEEIADKITEITERQKVNRHQGYMMEADPLFFKWQAGEATELEWQAKRQEIRERYPYPEE
jgi:hypothetical protein